MEWIMTETNTSGLLTSEKINNIYNNPWYAVKQTTNMFKEISYQI